MKKSSAKRSVNDRILFTLFCLFIFKYSQNLASLSLVASTIIAFSIFVHSLFAFLFLLPLLGLPPVFPFTSFVSRSHINTGSLHWLHWLSRFAWLLDCFCFFCFCFALTCFLHLLFLPGFYTVYFRRFLAIIATATGACLAFFCFEVVVVATIIDKVKCL